MTAAANLLPPVIQQNLHRVPLDPLSAFGFAILVVACAVLAFRRSAWIAAVLTLSVPFALYRDVGQTTLTLEKCVALGAASGFLIGGARLWPASRATRTVLLASCALLAAIALSTVDASFKIPVAREFLKQIEYVVLFWCAATCIERVPRAAVYFAGGAVASAAVVCALAIIQALVGGAPSGVWVNGHVLPRVTGTLEGPNQLAGFLESAMPLLWIWPLIASARIGRTQQALTAASSAATILTQSRAGVVVVWIVYALLWRLRRSSAKAVVTAMIAGLIFGFAVLVGWFVFWAHANWSDVWRMFLFDIPGAPGGVGTRAQLWPAALTVFRHHPLIGAGAGNFELLLPSIGLPGIQTHAASLPLQTLAEQGLVGFAALVVFAVIALRETYRARGRSPLALAAWLALTALLLHQLVDDLFFYPKAAALCWLLLGAGTAQHADEGVPHG